MREPPVAVPVENEGVEVHFTPGAGEHHPGRQAWPRVQHLRHAACIHPGPRLLTVTSKASSWRPMSARTGHPHTIYNMPIPESARPVRRPPARALALEQLQQWIEDGTLQPGEVLSDTEVATKLGVSRTPVREAFQRLEEIGLLVTTFNSRTQVAPAKPRDVESLYTTLAALHATAVEQAVQSLDERDLQRLEELNETLLQAVTGDDAPAASEADEMFHDLILERADNPFLRRVTEWLTVHARRLNTLYFSHHAPSENSYREHAEMIDAMRRRDGSKAAELTRRNMLRTVEVLVPKGSQDGA